MCGILGFASNVAINESEKLLQSIDLLDHRGPDDEGFFIDNKSGIGLSHRRLSILDTSRNGRQPMINNTNQISIIFII